MSRFAVVCMLLGACTLSPDHHPPPPLDTSVEVATYATVPSTKFDILFQVDNSPGVAEVQLDFANALPDFIAALDAFPGGRPDLHIGVVTSDLGASASETSNAADLGSCKGVGQAGNLQTSGAAVSGAFISDIEASDGQIRNTNYTGELAPTLATMLKVGGLGCGFEQQLRATKMALDGNTQNAGFSRTNANLLIVMLTDEDDCSVRDSALLAPSGDLGPVQSFRCTRYGVQCDEPVDAVGIKTNCHPYEGSPYVDGIQQYADYFSSAHDDRARTGIAVIASPPDPFAVELRTPPGGAQPELALAQGCTWQGSAGTDVADSGVRLAALTDQFHSHGLFQTVCQTDQRGHALAIAKLARSLTGVACLDDTVIDETTCTATVDTSAGNTRELHACMGDGDDECFEIVSDEAACPDTDDHARFVTHVAHTTTYEYVRVRCKPRELP